MLFRFSGLISGGQIMKSRDHLLAEYITTAKKALPLIIAFAISLSACANSAQSSTSTTTAPVGQTSDETNESVTERLTDNVPDLDFDGYKFRTIEQTRLSYGFYYDEETGDVVSDSIYKRNITVEERFNIDFAETVQMDYTDIMQQLKNSVLSNTDEYDLVFGQMFYSAQKATDGIFYDWNEMPYVDLTQPWYTKSIQDASIGRKLYIIESDLSISYTQQTWMILYNKTRSKDYSDFPDLYKTVRDGTWTIDLLTTLVKDCYLDLNGNSQRDADDFFGIASFQDGCQIAAFYYAGEAKLATLNDDFSLEHNILSEKAIDVITKISSLFNGNDGSVKATDNLIKDFSTARTMFCEGKVLFVPVQIASLLLDEVRNFQDEFGVLPLPKYDDAQKEYYTCVDGGADVLTVPVIATEEQCKIIGAVVEALSCLSYNDVTPTYCGVGLEVKGTRDEDSMEMVRIVLDSRVIDFSYLYDGFSGWVMRLPDMIKNPNKIASIIERNRKAVDKYFEKLISHMTND